MDVKQVYSIVNDIVGEVTGQTDLVLEDLSNLVDVGEKLFNSQTNYDTIYNSLLNRIGREIYVNRVYKGSAPNVRMDGWEYGSIMMKVTATKLPEATVNHTWDLKPGASYDPNIVRGINVEAKFFNKMVTFEIDSTILNIQFKQSFTTPENMNSFLSMLFNEIEKAFTIEFDALIMRTINNMTGETLANEIPDEEYSTNSTAKAINLLKLYNDAYPDAQLTVENCMRSPEFIRFVSLEMKNLMKRLEVASNIFNIGGLVRFTPKDLMHIVMLDSFKNAADVYLQSDTFHNELTQLPYAETVPFWQGTGEDYGFGSISEIQVNTATNKEVHASGILFVVFDHEALGVNCYDRRVFTHFNPVGEYTNYFYKFDSRYFNDLNENFVVGFVA